MTGWCTQRAEQRLPCSERCGTVWCATASALEKKALGHLAWWTSIDARCSHSTERDNWRAVWPYLLVALCSHTRTVASEWGWKILIETAAYSRIWRNKFTLRLAKKTAGQYTLVGLWACAFTDYITVHRCSQVCSFLDTWIRLCVCVAVGAV